LSILPTRGFVMSPATILPLTVSRPASIKLLDETLPLTKIRLLNQRDEQIEEAPAGSLHGRHRGARVEARCANPTNRS
jgi:ATP-dependent Lon protease